MKRPATYLDYNATAPVRPQVVDIIGEILRQPANSSSVHNFGRHAKKQLEDARKLIAEAISAFANEVIFTATGTEANVMALKGFEGKRIIVSAVEHSSVLKQSIHTIPVDANGVVDMAKLDAMLMDNVPSIISVMLANNETGVIQPISEVAAVCKKYNALLHCDAIQALGKIPVDFSLLGCDMMTLSAHKMGGAVGASCLVIKQNLPIKPILTGGGQELGRRAGTENIAAIAGFAKAVELIDLGQMKTLRGWLDGLEKQAKAMGATVFGESAQRLPNTSCIAMPGVGNEVQLMDFDLKGFAVSAGSACSSGRIEVSHVLSAMGVSKALAGAAIRVSGGWNTKREELDAFAEVWKQTCVRLSKKAAQG